MDENYCESPEQFEHTDSADTPKPGLPGFVKGWCIADLVFCSIRVSLLPVGVFGLAILPLDEMLYVTAILEIVTTLGICVCGLTGNIMLLLRKPSSIIFCWISVVSTVGNIAFCAWQGLLKYGNVDPGSPEAIGSLVVLGIVLVVRLALLFFYCMALSRAMTYFSTQPNRLGG